MITLAVFDMAGTTIQEHGAVYRALADAVTETGATLNDTDLQTWMGADKVEALTALIGLGGGSATAERVSQAFDRFRVLLAEAYSREAPTALPGVVEAIERLRGAGIRVALTTGFSRDVADPLLRGLGWDTGFVDAVVTSDEVAAGRPAPYMIHRAMERTGTLNVAEVLVAGDTIVDLAAGRASGAALTVGVLTGKLGREDLAAHPHDHILGSVAEIPELLGL